MTLAYHNQQSDYRYKWHVMATVGIGVLLGTIDGSIVNVALPTLVRELHTQFAAVQWVVLAYLLTIATLMLSIGRLADMVGKKKLYMTGMLVFTGGSALCGMATSIEWLISARVIQGVGAAMMTALGAAILTQAFPPSQRGRVLGINGAVVSIGIIIGPVVGGLLIASLSWHWIFLVNIPIGIAGAIMARRYVPAGMAQTSGQRFDYPGAGLLFILLLSLMLAMTLGQRLGFGAPLVLALACTSTIALGLFIAVENKSSCAIVDIRLFHNVELSMNLFNGFITFVVLGGTIILMPFYLENVLGYSPRHTGMLLAVVPIALGISSPISGALSDRFGANIITLCGLSMLLVGLLGLSTLGKETSAMHYILLYLPSGIGMVLFQSPKNSAIMGSAPAEKTGIVSGLLALTRTLGQTTGVAMIGALWAALVSYFSMQQGGNISHVSVEAQVSAINYTFKIMSGLVVFAIILTLLVRRKQVMQKRSTIDVPAN